MSIKLGSDTGSLVNYFYANSRYPKPEVGMGATVISWSDRKAVTIIKVCSPKTIIVQYDIATRVDENGMSDAQEYRYESNPEGLERIFTLRKNGSWVRKGDNMKGQCLAIGFRDEHYDYSF